MNNLVKKHMHTAGAKQQVHVCKKQREKQGYTKHKHSYKE